MLPSVAVYSNAARFDTPKDRAESRANSSTILLLSPNVTFALLCASFRSDAASTNAVLRAKAPALTAQIPIVAFVANEVMREPRVCVSSPMPRSVCEASSRALMMIASSAAVAMCYTFPRTRREDGSMKFGRFRISQVMAVTLGALAAIALAIALFNAVGGGGDRSAPADGVRCAPALAAARRIEGGLTVDGGGSLSNAQAVRSGDFDSVWFVAAEIDGPRLGKAGEIGLRAANAPTD